MDWAGVIANEPAEEEEMSMLAAGFSARMHKRAVGLEGESTPIFDGKRSKCSSLDEQAQKDWAIISIDSLDLAFNDQPVLEGSPSEADAPLEEGIPARGPSNVDVIGEGSSSGVAAASILPPKPAGTESIRKRTPDRVLLNTYVPLQEMIHSLAGMATPDLEGAREIIHHWSTFNQAKPPVTHMHDLYPNYFLVLVAACLLQYSIPFPVYMDKEAFQPVTEDEMLIRNHDFYRSIELA